ncbi:MAG TPA: RNA methyltransferase, partial [Hyphomonadaceae bacterium]|nr:RNA methyltransferase [Hyphomonadaceae bacterium]
MPIASADDPRIAPYRAVKERDLFRDDGRFIVEGAIALDALIGSRFPVESLLLAESRLAPMAETIARLDPATPVYAAAQEVMDGITGFHIHRGVLALSRRQGMDSVERLVARLGPGPLTLLALIGLADHDNVGSCFRNASGLAADAVLLDGSCCDPLYRKSIRVSSGAVLRLPFAQSGDGASIVSTLRAADIEPWALTPQAGEPIQAIRPPERLALLLGS